MSNVNVECAIKAYKKNDSDTNEIIILKSDWVYGDRAVLKIGENEYTVVISDMEKALQKCRNDY